MEKLNLDKIDLNKIGNKYNEFKDEMFNNIGQFQKEADQYIENDQNEQIDTLDEPVWDTLKRDFKMILYKLYFVVIPRKETKGTQLRNWDMWGPLILCLLLTILLSLHGNSPDTVFTSVFFTFWLGGIAITINTKYLGGHVSLMQSVCVLGYCVLPIVLSTFLNTIFFFLPLIIKLGISLLSWVWSSYASINFVATLLPPDRYMLGVYPIGIFYLFLALFSAIA